ncbi:hypothetical protein TorRG33x02_124340 [Trema orientale]|uniref:Uncharacterized protein n=1 Tax=Trema orientale TaxID=63057 RepID=A0A2P5F218_TREOI|nr:hypothetical protein TorRG33x02_124340 [Trema orientale]
METTVSVERGSVVTVVVVSNVLLADVTDVAGSEYAVVFTKQSFLNTLLRIDISLSFVYYFHGEPPVQFPNSTLYSNYAGMHQEKPNWWIKRNAWFSWNHLKKTELSTNSREMNIPELLLDPG